MSTIALPETIQLDTTEAEMFDGETIPLDLELMLVHNRDGSFQKVVVLATEEGNGAFVRDVLETKDENIISLEAFLKAFPTIESILENFSESLMWEASEVGARIIYANTLKGFDGIYAIPSHAPYVECEDEDDGE